MKLICLLSLLLVLAFGCQNQSKKKDVIKHPNKHFPNLFVHKKFATDGLIGFETDSTNFRLIPATDSIRKWSGNTINFKDSVHFVSAYVSWCGNDCFTTIYGRYYFVDHLKVEFYTDSITYDGDCRAPTKHTKSPAPLVRYLNKDTTGTLQLMNKPVIK